MSCAASTGGLGCLVAIQTPLQNGVSMLKAGYEFQPLEASHAEAYVGLHARAYSCAPEEMRAVEFVRAFLSLHGERGVGVWSEGELIGACCGVALGSYGAILECIVDPKYRREGLGTALLETVTESIRAVAEFCIIQAGITACWELRWLTLRGFQCVEPQFMLRKQVSEEATAARDEAKVSQWHDIMRLAEFGGQLEQKGLGHLLAVTAGDVCGGLLFVETAARRRVPSASVALSFGSVARSLGGGAMRHALALAEEVARRYKRSGVVVTLNSWHHREIELLLRGGWSLVRTSHRLVHVGGLSRYRQIQSLPQIDLSHWSL